MRSGDLDRLGEEIRRSLLDAGATPRDLAPLPGQGDRAEQFLERILETPRERRSEADEASDTRRRRARRGIVRSGLFAAAAAVVVLLVVVAQPTHVTPRLHAATPPLLEFASADAARIPATGSPAGPVLRTLADLARQQPSPVAAPVQHVSISAWWASIGRQPDGQVAGRLEPVDRASYFQPDGTMRVVERRGAPLDPRGQLVSQAAGETLTDESFLSSDPGPSHARRLPVDPDALRTTLGSAHDPAVCRRASGACLMSDVVDLFHNYVVPPRLTGALWDVLSTDPTVHYLGRTQDRLDRAAEAFATVGEDRVTQRLLLISPTTGAYLGEEVVLTRPSNAYPFEPPAVVSFSALLSAERIRRSALP